MFHYSSLAAVGYKNEIIPFPENVDVKDAMLCFPISKQTEKPPCENPC